MPNEYSLAPFFEQTADLLCIAGFDGYFKKVNPALCKLLEYSEEELLSRPINSFIHPEDREITSKHRENIFQGKPLLNFENRYVNRSEEIVWFSWTSIPKVEEKLVYAIAKDITHIKSLEKERNSLLTKLTKENEHLKKLNYTTSHDLRSPISNLLTIFELIDKSTILDPETKSFIELLEASANHLKESLDTYIDGFKNNVSLNVKITRVELPASLDYAKKALESLLQDAGATIHADFSDFSEILFNAEFMKSIFLNLLSNSLKYAHPDRNPEIRINAEMNNGIKQLIFSDNGIGFDASKAKDKVFGLYQTFHSNTDSKGIGLYLVYNHVSNMGGHISVDSEVGKGTTFTITFKKQ